MEKLFDGIEKLGWDNDEIEIRKDLHSWIRSNRQNGVDAWTTIGVIGPKGSAGFNRTAQLPAYVDVLRGIVYVHNASLISIAICLQFKESFKVEYDSALREPRQTFMKPLTQGLSFVRPMTQKIEAVHQVRRDIANMAHDWFRGNLPGVFCSGSTMNALPTCELITLQNAEPFPESSGPYYLRQLRIDFSGAMWQSQSVPDLKFAPYLLDDKLQNHSVLAIRVADSRSTAEIIDHQCRELISKWAIWPLLDYFGHRLNQLRDEHVSEMWRRPFRNPDETLRSLVDNVSHELDIISMTADLISSTQGPVKFGISIHDYTPCAASLIQKPFANFHCSLVSREAKKLMQTNNSLRDHFTPYGSLLAARENNRLQKRVICLTVAVLFLTVVTFFTGLFPHETRSFLERLWPL